MKEDFLDEVMSGWSHEEQIKVIQESIRLHPDPQILFSLSSFEDTRETSQMPSCALFLFIALILPDMLPYVICVFAALSLLYSHPPSFPTAY